MRFAAIGAIFLALIIAGMVFINHSTDKSIAARMLIVGAWRSTADTKFTREFKNDGMVIDTYEGSVPNSDARWTIFTKQIPVNGYSEPLEDGAIYLTIAAPKSDPLYFKIVKVDAHDLGLLYLDRSGTLTFTKE